MFVDCVINSGKPYLRVAESYSIKVDGVRKNRKRTIRNIGPLARFDDGKPNFLHRLKQSFKEGKPLIGSLDDLASQRVVPSKVTIEFDRSANCYLTPQNLGYFLLDGMYDALGIYDVLKVHKSRAAIDIDLNGLTRLLVFGRTLWPDSKLGTFEGRERYLFPITKSEKLSEVYKTLDVLDEKSEAIQKRMNLKIRQAVGRNTEICFYDVTNYYFEIEENDEGNGLRKKGVCKEKRNQPIVQMGLFIDDNGIPIAYRLFPGNNIDQTTLRPAMRKTIDNMSFGRVIIVADGGVNSGPNLAHILDGGNGYIVSKSTKKSDKTVRAWILDETGYKWNEARTFKVKSVVRTRKIKTEDGSDREIAEKLVCYWSSKHYERERRENEKFVEYLETVIAFPDKLKDKPRKIERFLKKTEIDKDTGEVVDTATSLSLDIGKIQEYLNLMGYYTIMTNEINKSDDEIISKYHGLSRIEDSFRITKSNLQGRPVFVRTPEHINAHFLTCFISLTMIRLIQHKILKHQSKPTNSAETWESGLSAERIQTALKEWQADALPNGYYRTTKPSEDLQLILNALGINAALCLPTIKELHDMKYLCDKIF
jgi:transposase